MLKVGQKVRWLGAVGDHDAKIVEVRDDGSYDIEFTKYPRGYSPAPGHRPLFGSIQEDQLEPVKV